MADEGIIYYATGDEYLEEAKESARSLQRHNSIDMTVYTDLDVSESELFDTVSQINAAPNPFYDRINYLKDSPYSKSLYLDTDTIITDDIEPIFDLLDRFDIVAAINETRDTAAEHINEFDTVDIDVPDPFPEYQCGVIGFNTNPTVIDLLDDFQDRYGEYKGERVLDQPFFRESLYNSSAEIGTLPSEYNTMVNFPGYVQERARILHFGGETRDAVNIPLISGGDKERVMNAINEHETQSRVFYYDFLNRFKMKPKRSIPWPLLFIRSLFRDGFVETGSKIASMINR